MANSDTDQRADNHGFCANAAKVSRKNIVNVTQESLVIKYALILCLLGTFRKRTDQLHKTTVATQLQTISMVPRPIGESTHPSTRLLPVASISARYVYAMTLTISKSGL